MVITAEQNRILIKEFSLRPEQVRAILRLKAYELYLRRGGKENIEAFENWLRKQKMIIQALNSIEAGVY